jgi:lipid II:glycine glycyltransferase (peptidoglycan interpeptide bridge formation enzyme)
MVYYRKKACLNFLEVWYTTSERYKLIPDVIKHRFVQKLPAKASFIENLYTILIDLSSDEEILWESVTKNTRYEIKRAKERDNDEIYTLLQCGDKNKTALHTYIDFFNTFAESKQRSKISYKDLAQFYEAGTLTVRSVVDRESRETLSMHAYIVTDGRARLYQSSSHFRNNSDPDFRKKSARANRYLHWEDILYFRSTGCEFYDLGGWYGGEDDKEKILINQFKESFGGSRIEEYTYLRACSLSGKVALFGRKMVSLAKKLVKI